MHNINSLSHTLKHHISFLSSNIALILASSSIQAFPFSCLIIVPLNSSKISMVVLVIILNIHSREPRSYYEIINLS
ncbi:hypothetical protein F383_31018 [Gossypium arboreum]|uniref:Uncharacterized protein n=1 Tax=Gossypium arboreum TaxID=29729 RepID=A0A0B0MX60_GOSAR|nr:hypothetical protein F383_31018 [Gossypium arboreum]